MFRNYLTVAVRNLVRHKLYSFINVFGLAVGIAFCILTFLFVRHEWTYDAFHENADSIYRVISFAELDGKAQAFAISPAPMAPALIQEIPGVKRAVRFKKMGGVVNYKDKSFNERILLMDPSFFQVFSFPLLKGNPATVLNNKNSIVISAEVARKYFGHEDPLGKSVSMRTDGYYTSRLGFQDFIVRGVVRKAPENSSIQFDFLLPFTNYTECKGYSDDWGRGDTYTYIQLSDNVRVFDLERQIALLSGRHYRDQYGSEGHPKRFLLQPITDIHLNTSVWWGMTPTSDPTNSYILTGIALLVLLIACINFMNLSITRSSTRSKEIGIRKVLGAVRTQLIRQFLGESVLLSFFSLLLGTALAEIFLPVFNGFVDKDLNLGYTESWSTWAVPIGLMLFVGLASGSYSAIVLSGFHPVTVLKDRLRIGGSNLFRRGLVVFQFSLSVSLVIGALVMSEQLSFLRTKHLGFNDKQVVLIPSGSLGRREQERLMDIYRSELPQSRAILSVTGTTHPLGRESVEMRYMEYKGVRTDVFCIKVDYDYLKTLDIPLVEGRDFSRDFPGDVNRSIIMNEAFIKKYGREGWRLVGVGDDPAIIGVVKDFHFLSLHHKIEPVVLYLRGIGNILVRISSEDIPATLSLLEGKWKTVAPNRPFEYSFLDEDMDRQYRADERWSKIVRYSALFAIFVACLGTLGLTSLAVTRRTKEIGVRKILGASISGIVLLLSKEFTKLVIVSNLIAWPVAYWVMNRWLQDFAYRINIGLGTFLLAGAIALAIALLTVSFQAIKAALANPVKALRYE